MRSYSFSYLETCDRCPFEATRNRMAPPPPNSNANSESGTLLHAWRQELLGIFQSGAAGADLDRLALEALTRHAVQAVQGGVREDVEDTGNKWYARRVAAGDLPRDGRAEVELAFDRAWKPVPYKSDQARFKLKIDYVTSDQKKTLTLLDHKTGHIVPAPIDWLQLEIYAWASFQLWPQFEEARLVFDFMRFDYRPARFVRKADLAWVPGELDRRIAHAEQIEDLALRGRAPAYLNRYCGRCNHRAACPALHEILAVQSMTAGLLPAESIASAERTAHTVKLLEAALEDAKKALKVFAVENGDVPAGDGKAWSPRPKGAHNPKLMKVNA